MRLNLATRQYHADADGPWLDLLRPNVAVSDYLGVLVRTYGIVAPFESACMYSSGKRLLPDFTYVMRAGLIAQDLLNLGLSPLQVATIPTCASIALFRTRTEALGWLYVVERATLLQDGVRRHLLSNLRVENACSYIAAYEGRVSEHWLAFGRQLDRAAPDATTANEIILSACDAFATCREWLRSMRTETRSVG